MVLQMINEAISKIDPLIVILVVSAFASFIITIAYKFATDQTEMKRLKDTIKKSQEKMKELQKKNKTKELMRVQQDAMGANMEYMRHSMKPTLITMIPLLFIFGWLAATMVYYNVAPNEQFSVFAIFDKAQGSAELSFYDPISDNISNKISDKIFVSSGKVQNVTILGLTPDAKRNIVDKNQELSNLKKNQEFNMIIWKITAKEPGKYNFAIIHNGESFNHSVLVSNIRQYSAPVKFFSTEDSTNLRAIIVGNKRVEYPVLGIYFGWLGIYIISSIVFGMLFRKWMNIY